MARSDPTRYADSVAFLLSQTGARSAQRFAARLADLGVSPRAFGVLSNLAADAGQTQQQLADALGIHRNNMVGLIDEMEAEGWLERRRGTQDRRVFHLHPTPAGLARVAEVNSVVGELDAELTQGLSAAQRSRLVNALRTIATTLELDPSVHPQLSARPVRR